MTREEAISELQLCVDTWDKWMLPGSPSLDRFKEAVKMGLVALRAPTREQVERMSGEWVHEPNKRSSLVYCSSCGESFNIHSYEVEKYGFCPYCGIPMTDKAVLVMERWEALKDGKGD